MQQWNARRMRLLCRRLINDLRLPAGATPEDLAPALCKRMGDILGKPVEFHLEPFPSAAVTGVWIEDGDTHLVLCEQTAPPILRLVIMSHEFWHVFVGNTDRTINLGDLDPGLTVASLIPRLGNDHNTLRRIVAARSICHSHDRHTAEQERDAERFGLIFSSMVIQWVRHIEWQVPADAVDLVGRIEGFFGPNRQPHPRGSHIHHDDD